MTKGGLKSKKSNGLVLGCIEAKFFKQILVRIRIVGKLSPRSAQCTPLHRSLISFFSLKIAESFADFETKNLQICKSVGECLLNVDQFFSGFSQNVAIFIFFDI